jgi:amidohydrolase
MTSNSFLSPEFVESMRRWRRDFHRHPELGFEEHRTAAAVADLLKEFGIEVHAGIGGTGVVGVLRRGSGERTIGLRAEMDALAIQEANGFAHASAIDGRMHACGHDGHTAMLLGAACHLAVSTNFDGTVFFIFQPAEEHGRGARAMIDDGLFERFPADSLYAIHNLPSVPVGTVAVNPGPVMACEDNFEIVIDGKGTHAALPHLGVDTIVIGSAIVQALQTVVARTMDPVERGVVSVTEFISDGIRNAIPGRVVLKGDTRSFVPSVQEHIEQSMARIVSGICAAHGAGSDFSYTHEFVATVNSAREAEIAAAVARDVVGDGRVISSCDPVMFSEDFGHMLRERPGCNLLIGNGGDHGLHNPNYDFNDENLPVGAAVWVRLVETQLAAASASA